MKNIVTDKKSCVDVVEEMKCCICGKPITDDEGHDPYPVRPESWYGEKENRCCADCNYTIVIPVRFRCGRHAQQHVARLREMDYKELSAFVADMGIRFPIINPRMLTYVPTTCKSSVAKAISL